MPHPLLTVLDKGWPFAASILASVFAFGYLKSDVADLKSKQTSAQMDHDAITALVQSQQDIKETLTDIKHSLERIEKK
jgi:hypothetical protein